MESVRLDDYTIDVRTDITSGTFGCEFSGVCNSSGQRVRAVPLMEDGGVAMATISHRNLVKLLAVCHWQDRKLAMLEECSLGRLEGYMEEYDVHLSLRLHIMAQVVSVVEYLTSREPPIPLPSLTPHHVHMAAHNRLHIPKLDMFSSTINKAAHPVYSAPEVLLHEAPPDEATCVFAAGVMLYQMLLFDPRCHAHWAEALTHNIGEMMAETGIDITMFTNEEDSPVVGAGKRLVADMIRFNRRDRKPLIDVQLMLEALSVRAIAAEVPRRNLRRCNCDRSTQFQTENNKAETDDILQNDSRPPPHIIDQPLTIIRKFTYELSYDVTVFCAFHDKGVLLEATVNDADQRQGHEESDVNQGDDGYVTNGLDVDRCDEGQASTGQADSSDKRRIEEVVEGKNDANRPKLENEIDAYDMEEDIKEMYDKVSMQSMENKDRYYTLYFEDESNQANTLADEDTNQRERLVHLSIHPKGTYTKTWERRLPTEVSFQSVKYVLDDGRLVMQDTSTNTTHVYSSGLDKLQSHKGQFGDLCGVLGPDRLLYVNDGRLHLYTVHDHQKLGTLSQPVKGVVSVCEHPASGWLAVTDRDEDTLDIYSHTLRHQHRVPLPFTTWEPNGVACVGEALLIGRHDPGWLYVYNWAGQQLQMVQVDRQLCGLGRAGSRLLQMLVHGEGKDWVQVYSIQQFVRVEDCRESGAAPSVQAKDALTACSS